ncbi:hypothetical protein SERLA73DRAFT_129315 [Serpula lacrymans var. lacrymans S7.3]|uniref:Aminoglycoside phosphotransferase domain-containing protein n=2 Tax=Serpula lacrymans var. lacrymans TaxID=341189 RepID=F8PGE9_SERL3|nr:uncharacterized protein SERLADRAFT_405099 [Serpula lacrymans var. lacrymans S7.9]EGO05382.1 hypothetical protein SERLA73DRAFT_129315 [Serpula lacrymans var. lacrymans S7.3]EGO31233.1 hypothetical protein SERLADRAFT_405099 [Serpula lacrymans var. lacrymans S7.9]
MRSDVYRLTSSTVVKKGKADRLRLEAEASRFVALHTSIPVPAIYDFWEEGDGNAYLVMEYKEGEILQRKWRQLSPDQKMTVMRTLRRFVEELRVIPQPAPRGWIGSVSKGALYDYRISSQSAHGPFQNEDAYNDWRISTFSWFGTEHSPTGVRLQQLREEMPNDHRITFTHADITRRNILVSVTGEGADDVTITALLDWEQAGWRPEFWEAAKFMFGVDPTNDWIVLGRQEVVPGYDLELAREDELLFISGPPQ